MFWISQFTRSFAPPRPADFHLRPARPAPLEKAPPHTSLVWTEFRLSLHRGIYAIIYWTLQCRAPCVGGESHCSGNSYSINIKIKQKHFDQNISFSAILCVFTVLRIHNVPARIWYGGQHYIASSLMVSTEELDHRPMLHLSLIRASCGFSCCSGWDGGLHTMWWRGMQLYDATHL